MDTNKESKKRIREEDDDVEPTEQKEGLSAEGIPKSMHRVVRQRSEDHSSNNDPSNLPPLCQLRLEAIFHPKFENESQNNNNNEKGGDHRRQTMLENVSKRLGYLEASLKHSGSLLLWSGEQRYYSKNSTNNAFSMVGEILLRQHFARAWWLDGGNDEKPENEGKYKKCSAYISSHRLTLAFEVVTSVLGHHGSLPHKDFLVLTAVADRSQQRFYSTEEVAKLAQQFRLPHNDYWTFDTESSAKSLFDWYDAEREAALAKKVCSDLDDIADRRRLRSLYPHSVFQGEIVEGIVVRYVPYTSERSTSNVGDGDTVMEEADDSGRNKNEGKIMDQLAYESEHILHLVPPERPPSFVLFSSTKGKEEATENKSQNTVLTTDVRELYQSMDSNEETIQKRLCFILQQTDGQRRRIHRLKTKRQSKKDQTNSGGGDKGVDVPALVNELLLSDSLENESHQQNGLDNETLGIANLIQTLHSMNGPIQFNMMKEETPPAENADKNKPTTRWLCIIHILQDSIFPQYMKKMDSKKDMMLYRGFCVRMIFKGEKDIDRGENDFKNIISKMTTKDSGPPLMLKMKFLPYMVRTFGCRNGLRILDQTGLSGYERYTLNLLTKWGMSSDAIAKWQPFFCSWGFYANDVLQRSNNRRRKKKDGSNSSSQDDGLKEEGGSVDMIWNEDLPPLTAQTYLHHLERFQGLNDQGKISSNKINSQDKGPCTYRGVVVVVGLTGEDSAPAADLLSTSLGGCKRSSEVNKITEDDVHMAMVPVNGGLVVDAVVEDGFGALKRLGKKFGDMIHVILVGCDDDAIEASIDMPMKDKKRRKGMLSGWRRFRCKEIIDTPLSCFSVSPEVEVGSGGDAAAEGLAASTGNDEAFHDLIEKLKTSSDSLPKADERPGALLFFPGIPGSGKSTLCGAVSTEALCVKLGQMDTHLKDNESVSLSKSGAEEKKSQDSDGKFDRPVIVRVGDSVKEKYWPLVRRERLESRSSLYIADKNATSTVWNTIAEVCGESRGAFVPVLPYSAALSTSSLMFVSGTGAENKREYVFPFSLQYLAVCISRVLQRPKKSHKGKLDAATPNACMIVVKFYCLYKGLTAERLKETCNEMANTANAVNVGSDTFFISVPFFNDDVPLDLPKDLRDALIGAIQLQCNAENAGETDDTAATGEMEKRLRALVTAYKDMLQGLTVSKEASCESFLSQIASLTNTLDSCDLTENPKVPYLKKIKIASIDVNAADVHRILKDLVHSNTCVAEFLGNAGAFDPLVTATDEVKTERYIKDTHVTMAHFSRTSQHDMRKRFSFLEGSELDVVADGFLFSDKIAALSVEVPRKTLGDQSLGVPACENAFPHITVWCGDGAEAKESNDLPSMVIEGKAKRIDFHESVSLHGIFRFWYDDAKK